MSQNFNHKHLLIRASVQNPPTTREAVEAWLLETVAAVEMKVLMGPYSIRCDTVGNVGITGATIIETSHLSLHSWEQAEPAFIQADLYSCADFTTDTFLDVFNRHFSPHYVNVVVMDRNCNADDGASGGRMYVLEDFVRRYDQ